MSSPRVSINSNAACYFITFTVKHWYYVFDRYNRWQIIADSLQYCVNNKELKLYGFVFMLNHIHMLFYCPDTIGFIRDFKKFTSKELRKSISETEPHMLKIFLTKDESYEFWEKTNMPILVESEKFFYQKLQYIHYNPVRKKYVQNPEYWYWSSANLKCELKAEALF